jgi:biopolymer transport protein ExbD
VRQPTPGFVRRDALHQWKLQFGPNMTPMVDIVLVILVFFMATAAFIGEEWFVQASIPSASGPSADAGTADTEEPSRTVHVRLRLDDAGAPVAWASELGIEGQPIERLIEHIRTLAPDDETASSQLMIIADTDVIYRDILRVHEASSAAGITKVGLGSSNEAR